MSLHSTNYTLRSCKGYVKPDQTGKLVTPATRFTVTSSYRILVRMIYLPKEILGRNTALAGTHGKRNETRSYQG